jgi:ABC-type nickel/cobalt efflux system permease component RcnA
MLAALVLGFLLGLRHATDADHVVAVSTIVSEYRNPWRGLWIGASWGLGHTTPLLVLGAVILALKGTVLQPYGALAPYFELGVGAMLIFLGVQVFWNLKRGKLHLHEHTHDKPHVHIHATHVTNDQPEHGQVHGILLKPGKPFFRPKSFFIGIMHGLAGSAAVMLVLIPQLPSFAAGLGYLVLFGLGTMLSMAVITLLMGVPFALSSGFRRLSKGVTGVAGMASIVFGVMLISTWTQS